METEANIGLVNSEEEETKLIKDPTNESRIEDRKGLDLLVLDKSPLKATTSTIFEQEDLFKNIHGLRQLLNTETNDFRLFEPGEAIESSNDWWRAGWRSPLNSKRSLSLTSIIILISIGFALILLPITKSRNYIVALLRSTVENVCSFVTINYPFELAGGRIFDYKRRTSLIVSILYIVYVVVFQLGDMGVYLKYGYDSRQDFIFRTLNYGFLVYPHIFIMPLYAGLTLTNPTRSKIWLCCLFIVFVMVVNYPIAVFIKDFNMVAATLAAIIGMIIFQICERKKITRDNWAYVYCFCLVQAAVFPLLQIVLTLSNLRGTIIGDIALGLIFSFIAEFLRGYLRFLSKESLERVYIVSSVFVVQAFDDVFSKYIFFFNGTFTANFFVISAFFAIRVFLRDSGLIEDFIKFMTVKTKSVVSIKLLKKQPQVVSLQQSIQNLKLVINEQEFKRQQYFITGISSFLIVIITLVYEFLLHRKNDYCILICRSNNVSYSIIGYLFQLALWGIARVCCHFFMKYKRKKSFDKIIEKELQLEKTETGKDESIPSATLEAEYSSTIPSTTSAFPSTSPSTSPSTTSATTSTSTTSTRELTWKEKDTNLQKEIFLKLNSSLFWRQSLPHVIACACYAITLTFLGVISIGGLEYT